MQVPYDTVFLLSDRKLIKKWNFKDILFFTQGNYFESIVKTVLYYQQLKI